MLIQVFEFGMLALFALCIVDALRKGKKRTFELAAAAIAGLTLEVLAVLYLGIYQYTGGFWVQIMDVPICIGLGWGIVVYISMSISDNLGLGKGLRPVFDGLLGLNIDLAMDVVAIRMGLWSWDFGGFFGVPYLNYIVWFIFVFICSISIRYFRAGGPAGFKEEIIVNKVLMLVPGIIDSIFIGVWRTAGDVLLIWKGAPVRFKLSPKPKFEPISFIVVTGIHLFFLAVLLHYRWFGIPWLLVISVSMLVLGLVLHLYPVFHGITKRESRLPWIPAVLGFLLNQRKF